MALWSAPNAAADTEATPFGKPQVLLSQVPQGAQGGGSKEQLYQAYITDAGDVAFRELGPLNSFQYNAIGYREKDGLVYGIRSVGSGNTAIGNLVQIDGNGNVVDLGAVWGLTDLDGNTGFTSGTFGSGADADKYYIRTGETKGTEGTGRIYVLDFGNLKTSGGASCSVVGPDCKPSVTVVPLATVGNKNMGETSDLFYADGYLWGVHVGACQGSGNCEMGIYRIDINNPSGTATWVDFPLPGILDADRSAFGGQWVYGNGDFGIANQGTGAIYRYTISNASGTPTFTLQSITTPASNTTVPGGKGNDQLADGTCIPGKAVDLKVEKAVDKPYFQATDTLTYTITVTNTSGEWSSGWYVKDTLSPYIDTTTVNLTGTNCTLSSGVITCTGGELAPGKSATITYTAKAKAGTNVDVVNTVKVTGDQHDPAGGNNTATATTKPIVLTLTKTATPATVSAVGQTITYTFTVKNGGQAAVNGLAIVDPWLPSVTCVATTLTPGATTTCTGTHTVTQTDLDSPTGTIKNTAKATGTTGGQNIQSNEDTATVTVTQTGKIKLTKKADPEGQVTPGTVVTYTFILENQGNVTLTDVHVTDKMTGLSAVTCNNTTLAPGQSTTCEATYTVNESDVVAGKIKNDATASGKVPTGGTVTDTASVEREVKSNPSISVTKDGKFTAPAVAGTTKVTYTFVVENTGDVTLTGVTLTDPMLTPSTVTCPQTTLAPKAKMTCTAEYTIKQSDIDAGIIKNTATASGQPPTGVRVSGTSTKEIELTRAPEISVTKTAQYDPDIKAGNTITYSIEVTNSGNVTLTGVTVTDTMVGLSGFQCKDWPGAAGVLAPDQSVTCTATYKMTQDDIDKGGVTNKATATGTAPDGKTVEDDDSYPITVVSAPRISLDKWESHANSLEAGSIVTYHFTIKNEGNVTLTDVSLSDSMINLSNIQCPDFQPPAKAELLPGHETTCTATYEVTQADVDKGSISNSAGVTGKAGSKEVEAHDTETITIAEDPRIHLTKSADDKSLWVAGMEVTYHFSVTNTGNVTLSNVRITDPRLDKEMGGCEWASIKPKEVKECTATFTLTQAIIDSGELVNTATVTGDARSGEKAEDSDTHTLEITPHPSIKIDKSATPRTPLEAGKVIDYEFLVENTGNVTLTDVSVTDPLKDLSDIVCPVSKTLLPGEKLKCTASYTIKQSDIDNGGVSNTATATGNPPTGEKVTGTGTANVPVTPNGSIDLRKWAEYDGKLASGTQVTYYFTVTNSGNLTLNNVTVTDPLDGLSKIDCPKDSLIPGETMTCDATYTMTQEMINAGGVHNTATAKGTPVKGPMVSKDSSWDITVRADPQISLKKTPKYDTPLAAGDEIAYNFLVTNTGNVTLTDIRVTDPLLGAAKVDCPKTTLQPATAKDPGESMTCTATYEITQTDINAGGVTNKATAFGVSPSGDTVLAESEARVDVPSSPGLTVEKSADYTPAMVADDVVHYTILVRNTGNVTLHDVMVKDESLPGLSELKCQDLAPAGQLIPRQEFTCTATYTLKQSDIDNGSLENTATATGKTPGNTDVTGEQTKVITIDPAPGVRVKKTAKYTGPAEAGTEVEYEFLVTNTGNVTLIGVTVTDPMKGLKMNPCPASVLLPGASMVCTAEYVVTQADADAKGVHNVATATGQPPKGDPVTGTGGADITITAAPKVSIAKTATPERVDKAGTTVTYVFTILNEGNVTLSGITVEDKLPGLSQIHCPPKTDLAPGDPAMICTATYVVTQADIDAGGIHNVATVKAEDPDGKPVDGKDEIDVEVDAKPGIQVIKKAELDPPLATGEFAKAGMILKYSFEVTNTGNVTLTDIRVDDPKLNSKDPVCTVPRLAPGLSEICTATYTLTQADIDAGGVTNKAFVSAKDPDGDPVDGDDEYTEELDASPGISVVKKGDIDPSLTTGEVPRVGTKVLYEFAVTNTGNVTLTDVKVEDPMIDSKDPVCTVSELAPGLSETCTATYVLTQADIDAGKVTNKAIATGQPPTGKPVKGEGEKTLEIEQKSGLQLTKSVSPTGPVAGGTMLTYTLRVVNTGNVTVSGVTITEDPLVAADDSILPDGVTWAGCEYDAGNTVHKGVVDNGKAVLAGRESDEAFGEAFACTATYKVPDNPADVHDAIGSVTNKAHVTGDSPDPDPDPTDEDEVTTYIAYPLLITKTADPTGRVYEGTSVTYTITVTNMSHVLMTGIEIKEQALLNGAGQVKDTNGRDVIPEIVSCTYAATNTDPAHRGTATSGEIELGTGEAVTCVTSAYTVTAADAAAGATLTNQATATGVPQDDPAGRSRPVMAEAVSDIAHPELTVVKTVDKAGPVVAGDTLHYTLTATNTGDDRLTGVRVVEDRIENQDGIALDTPPTLGNCRYDAANATHKGDVVNGTATLEPGEKMSCDASYVVTQKNIDDGVTQIVNRAHGTGTDGNGEEVEAPSTTVPTDVEPGASSLSITKTFTNTTATRAKALKGDVLVYTFTVKNTGTRTLHDVVVEEGDFSGYGPPPVVQSCKVNGSTVTITGFTLAVGQTAICTSSSYTVTQQDVDAGQISNTATAKGDDPKMPEEEGEVVVPIDQQPGLHVVKTVDKTTANVGDMLNYTLTITNTGNVTLTYQIVDTFGGLGTWNAQITGCTDPSSVLPGVVLPFGPLAPGHTVVCTMAPYKVLAEDAIFGAVTNSVVINGAGAQAGETKSNKSEVTTKVNSPEVEVHTGEKVSTGGTAVPAQNGSLALAALILGLGVALALRARALRTKARS